MRYAVASSIAFAAAVVASPVAQGVTDDIKPSSSAPSGCASSYDSDFQIQVVNVTMSASKRSLSKRQQDDAMTLEISLKDGVLTDSKQRTGYIAANHQFQFDGPAQTGAIYTAGWSACGNGSLALGGTTVFFQCLSGDFYNLYDESTGDQCNEVHINMVMGGAAASQLPDGQPQETPSVSAPVSQIPDGQIQASTSGAPVSQIPDGQIQASTAAATGAPVSQIPDGQIQASTAAATGAAVSQIPDGQIQAAPTASPVSQIPDGQVQAPYSNGTAAMPAAPSGPGVGEQPAPFEGSANKAYTAGAAAVVALFGLVVAL
jgi:hypothetical protein